MAQHLVLFPTPSLPLGYHLQWRRKETKQPQRGGKNGAKQEEEGKKRNDTKESKPIFPMEVSKLGSSINRYEDRLNWV